MREEEESGEKRESLKMSKSGVWRTGYVLHGRGSGMNGVSEGCNLT